MNRGPGAYNRALAFESASNLYYNEATGKYELPMADLERYARIVAYKVAHNLKNGWTMDPDQDPLTYYDCGSNTVDC